MKSYIKTIINAFIAWAEPKFNTLFSTKADKISDSEIVEMMVEEGIVDPVTNGDNAMYADSEGKIYVL